MKKFFTCLGLLLGGFVVNIVRAYLLSNITILMLLPIVSAFFVRVNIIIIAHAVVGMVLLIELFRKKMNINAPLFIITTQLPSTVISTAYFFYLKYNGTLFYYLNKPIFYEEDEYLLFLSISISSTAILVLTIITCLIIYLVRKSKMKKHSKLDFYQNSI